MSTELTKQNNEVVETEMFSFVPVNSVYDMTKNLSIYTLSKADIKVTKVQIVKIITKYLSATPKAKTLNEISFEIITDDIMETCKSWSLQEIDYVFKMGVSGKLCLNYQEISIDTIIGNGGWLDVYFRNYRRNKPNSDNQIKLTGKEITLDEFLTLNPEYKKQKEENENLYLLAKNYAVNDQLLRRFHGKNYDKLVNQAKEKYNNALNQLIEVEQIISKLPKNKRETHRIVKHGLKNILKYDINEYVRRFLNESIKSNNLKI